MTPTPLWQNVVIGRFAARHFVAAKVKVGDTVRTIPMTDDTATLRIAAGKHVVVDPSSRILERNPAPEAVKSWRASQNGATQ